MLIFKVQWNGVLDKQVNSLVDLESLLDRIHYDKIPVMVVVESLISGNSMAIGLGRDLSVLNFVDGSGDPPFYTSLGTNESEETIEFNFMGENSEFPIRNAIPLDAARNAIREFFESEKRTTSIKWEKD